MVKNSNNKRTSRCGNRRSRNHLLLPSTTPAPHRTTCGCSLQFSRLHSWDPLEERRGTDILRLIVNVIDKERRLDDLCELVDDSPSFEGAGDGKLCTADPAR